MDKTLEKKSLTSWLKKLEAYDVYAPVLKDELYNYALISPKERDTFVLDFLNTVQAPKKLILPQVERLLDFVKAEDGSPEITETLPHMNPTIVFGVRPCDGRAVTLHDMVFGGNYTDPYYWDRRDASYLVGLTCNTPPWANCFCTSVNGSPHSREGLDILLTDLGSKYFVEVVTKKGEELVKTASTLFKAPAAKDKKDLEQIKKEADKNITRQIKDLKKVPPKLKGMFDSPIWDEEAMSCLRCGICTFLCPTCHCFDISDEVTSSLPLKGHRIRTWDTCQFPDFTMHSSGHNPRPDKASRLRQRMLHKFQYFVEINKEYQCTGCGRCVSLCPVGIDIIEVLDKVRDYG